MVTKWKNKKWLLVIVWLLLFSHGAHGVMTALHQGRDYIGKNYFESDAFQNELNDFVHHLFLYEIDYIPLEEAKEQITVSDEEIHEHRYRYGDLNQQIENIKAQYEPKMEEASENQNQQAVEAYRAERDKKIEDITQNFLSDEHVRKKIAEEKEAKLEKIYQELDQLRHAFLKEKHHSFVYRLTDPSTGRVFTNLREGDETTEIRPGDVAYVKRVSRLGFDEYRATPDPLDELPIQKRSTIVNGQIAATNEIVTTSAYEAFQTRQQLFYFYTMSGLVALIVSLTVFKRWNIASSIAPRVWQEKYDRIPIDLAIGISGVTLLILMSRYESNHLVRFPYPDAAIKDLIYSALWTAIGLSLALYLYHRLKETRDLQAVIQNSLSFKIGQAAKQAFLIRSTGTQVILLLLFALGVGPGLIVALMIDEFLGAIYFFLAAICGLPLLYIILRQAGYFNQIAIHLEDIAQGHSVPDIRVKGNSKLAKMAENVNQIKQGVKVSQRERAKSERLKTELITNVSHDLRTPLTSVITYTELLKRPNLTNEERNAYIEIIDRKSKRLKTLIDDLFEASKMASGSVELSKQRVDLAKLLQQALAEYDEQIKASSLQFRVTIPETPVYAYVDGQKLWRAFDNLIGNILKYSLEHTRVYISVESDATKARFVFRNIAKYELGVNEDELFERFKRGDTSRQTEGSGLGLAIAKSIVDLHDGHLDIQVDGDLFKVTITLNV